MRPVVISRSGAEVPFNYLRIAEAILRAAGAVRCGGSKMLFGEWPIWVLSRKIAVSLKIFIAINMLILSIKFELERRQVLTWLNVVCIVKLYVERPNNKSPPVVPV